MPEILPSYESCDCDVPAKSGAAYICSFESTFRACHAGTKHIFTCHNCGGELVRRPVRPVELLARFAPATRG